MNALDQQLATLTEKLQLLLQQQARLQKENNRLMQELEARSKAEAAHKQQTAELEQRIAIIKYAAGDMPEAEKKAFEKKLSAYIRDIDKVIMHLSQ